MDTSGNRTRHRSNRLSFAGGWRERGHRDLMSKPSAGSIPPRPLVRRVASRIPRWGLVALVAFALVGVSTPGVLDFAQTADLLYRVEAVMAQSTEGQRLIDLYYKYSPNLADAILPDRALVDEGFAVIELFVPGLEALVEGRGSEVTITQEQVDAVEVFLDHLYDVADPELQQVIIAERGRRPFQAMVGLTMDQAWLRVNGYSLEWKSPSVTEQAQTVLDETLHIHQGDLLLVEFVLRDYLGNPVHDPTAVLDVFDGGGPLAISSNPDEGPMPTAIGDYSFILATADLGSGPHDISVWFNSVSGEPARLNLWIDESLDNLPAENGGSD